MRKLTSTVGSTLLCCLLVSCGGGGPSAVRSGSGLLDDLFRSGDDLVRSGASQADGTLKLPHVEVPLPAGDLDSFADDVGRATAALPEQHIAGLTEEEATTVIDYACTAAELFEDGRAPTLADAIESVVPQNFASELKENVEKLAEDLAETQTSLSAVQVVAGAAVCQYAGLPR